MTITAPSTQLTVFDLPHTSITAIEVSTSDGKAVLTPKDVASYDWSNFIIDVLTDVTAADGHQPGITLEFRYEGDPGNSTYPLVGRYGVASLDGARQHGERLISVVITCDEDGNAFIAGNRDRPMTIKVCRARLSVNVLIDGSGEVTSLVRSSDKLSLVTFSLENLRLLIEE